MTKEHTRDVTSKLALAEQDEVWTCRDGTDIPICKLTEVHMRNIIRMIVRQNNISETMLHECTYEDTL